MQHLTSGPLPLQNHKLDFYEGELLDSQPPPPPPPPPSYNTRPGAALPGQYSRNADVFRNTDLTYFRPETREPNVSEQGKYS